jgi:starch synthase
LDPLRQITEAKRVRSAFWHTFRDTKVVSTNPGSAIPPQEFRAHEMADGRAAKSPRFRRKRRPRILIVTPEFDSSSAMKAKYGSAPKAKAGGLAEVCTLLFDSLSDLGADVHISMPYFRGLFRQTKVSRRLHLCHDREFFYRRAVYDGSPHNNRLAAMVFQREIIHHVLPRVRPDIVHCHDWMTGLVPAAAKGLGIKSLFTVHNLHDETATLAEIEDRGIDAARFWDQLYYREFPSSYAETRDWNAISFMASAVHAADRVNTVSPSFLREIMDGHHPGASGLVEVLRAKYEVGSASGIINAPSNTWDPRTDSLIRHRYDHRNHLEAKRSNKLDLQRLCGLEENSAAPLMFWPSRLDPVQKGCQLLAEILFRVISEHYAAGLQVVFVADGPFQQYFEQIADFHNLRHRIAVCPFNDALSRQAYAASDFVLMPSAYEPCGLAQMVGLKYGSLPIVYRTGGLQDTVSHLDPSHGSGNGFVFEVHDSNGLKWAIDQAINFHRLPAPVREGQIARIMEESAVAFAPNKPVCDYLSIYETLAGRSLF